LIPLVFRLRIAWRYRGQSITSEEIVRYSLSLRDVEELLKEHGIKKQLSY
jgi:transposase-like protein